MFIFDISNGYVFCLEILTSIGFRILYQYTRNLHLFMILSYKTNSGTNFFYLKPFDYPKIIRIFLIFHVKFSHLILFCVLKIPIRISCIEFYNSCYRNLYRNLCFMCVDIL